MEGRVVSACLPACLPAWFERTLSLLLEALHGGTKLALHAVVLLLDAA